MLIYQKKQNAYIQILTENLRRLFTYLQTGAIMIMVPTVKKNNNKKWKKKFTGLKNFAPDKSCTQYEKGTAIE